MIKCFQIVVFFVAATRIILAAWLPLVPNISHELTGFQIISTAGAEKMMIFVKGRRIVWHASFWAM